MSKNSLNLVIEKQNHIPLLIINTKLQLKSDKTAPFGGIFFVNKFVKQNNIPQLIDKELGKRVRLAGYQYSEIFSALLNIYLCGGDHIEDISYLGQFLRQEPNARIPSSDAGLLQLDAIFKSSFETERIAPLIDAFFAGHLPHKEDLNYSRLRKVIAACDEAKGNISASQMAQVACLGERQFLRVFKTYVGIPPKQFIRLRRFHRTIRQMQQTAHAGKPLNLLSIALAHGYYDLSHMALEFQQMGCVSPSHFRALGIPLSDDFSVFFA